MNLTEQIKACRICAELLPHEPNPVVSFSLASRIVIIGQAPGIKVHRSGIPWRDASGDRLRDWLGVDAQTFYDTRQFGIVPMGFCYPGKGKSGDLPPRPECAAHWMEPVLASLPNRQLTLLIGQYAQKYFLGDRIKATLTETVRSGPDYHPQFFTLPHPSPRNNIWLRKNQWFEQEVLPQLKARVGAVLLG